MALLVDDINLAVPKTSKVALGLTVFTPTLPVADIVTAGALAAEVA